MDKPIGRPVIVPRGPLTPFGRALEKAGISARALGEAIAVAERKPERLPTVLVNRWVWGHTQPSSKRQRLFAKWLKQPVEDLFPPPPSKKPKRPKPELDLLAAAAELRDELERDAGAAEEQLTRARSQKRLPMPGTSTGPGDVPCIIERKKKRPARKGPRAAERRAA